VRRGAGPVGIASAVSAGASASAAAWCTFRIAADLPVELAALGEGFGRGVELGHLRGDFFARALERGELPAAHSRRRCHCGDRAGDLGEAAGRACRFAVSKPLSLQPRASASLRRAAAPRPVCRLSAAQLQTHPTRRRGPVTARRRRPHGTASARPAFEAGAGFDERRLAGETAEARCAAELGLGEPMSRCAAPQPRGPLLALVAGPPRRGLRRASARRRGGCVRRAPPRSSASDRRAGCAGEPLGRGGRRIGGGDEAVPAPQAPSCETSRWPGLSCGRRRGGVGGVDEADLVEAALQQRAAGDMGRAVRRPRAGRDRRAAGAGPVQRRRRRRSRPRGRRRAPRRAPSRSPWQPRGDRRWRPLAMVPALRMRLRVCASASSRLSAASICCSSGRRASAAWSAPRRHGGFGGDGLGLGGGWPWPAPRRAPRFAAPARAASAPSVLQLRPRGRRRRPGFRAAAARAGRREARSAALRRARSCDRAVGGAAQTPRLGQGDLAWPSRAAAAASKACARRPPRLRAAPSPRRPRRAAPRRSSLDQRCARGRRPVDLGDARSVEFRACARRALLGLELLGEDGETLQRRAGLASASRSGPAPGRRGTRPSAPRARHAGRRRVRVISLACAASASFSAKRAATQRMVEQRRLGLADIARERAVAHREARLPLQRFELLLDLADDVVDALEVGFGGLQPQFGLVAARMEAGNAGGLFEHARGAAAAWRRSSRRSGPGGRGRASARRSRRRRTAAARRGRAPPAVDAIDRALPRARCGA
jgi:hypothetical protein